MIIVNNVGAKRLLLYFVVSFLTSAVVAPPERNFNFTQGQPELQQAMDNMVVREPFTKRTVRLPSADDKGIQYFLTDKTTQLLEEAERMMSPVKDVKDKEWMDGFIHKLQQLASVLQQSTVNQNSEKEAFTVQEVAQSLNSTTVPEGHYLQQNSSDLISTAVLQSRSKLEKSDQMTSKFPVTLYETDQVKPVSDSSAEHSVVTTPGLSPVEEVVEEDELVRELHQISSLGHSQQEVEAPETSSTSVAISTPSPSNEETVQEKQKIEYEKEKIKKRLAAEIAELKRLGETEEGIVSALHMDKFKLIGSKEVNKFEETNHESVKRVLNEKDEGIMAKVDPNYWNLPAFHTAEPPRQIYMNNTFLGMHINLPPVNPRIIRRQFHYGLHRNAMIRNAPYYQAGLRDTIQKLQAQNHQSFIMKNHMFGAPNILQQESPNNFRPVEVNPEAMSQSNRFPPDNPTLKQQPKINLKTIYMPYPLSQNSDLKNEFPGNTHTTYSTDSLPTEFSDEMKRQLRDGKVILLSDSVVRSNFTSESEKNGKDMTEESV